MVGWAVHMFDGFAIKDWYAFAPALPDREAWQRWATSPIAVVGDETPALRQMPAIQRRRLERVGRLALQVAYGCQTEPDPSVPLIFASRHGDLVRTLEMMQRLARDEPLSPTQFGLSTHNAIAAQYTIARQLTANHLAVSAGLATAEAAFLEAISLLNDGAQEVLIVVYDTRMPGAYQGCSDEPEGDYAWACRVAVARDGERRWTLQVQSCAAAGAGSALPLPHGLRVLQFLISGERELVFAADGCCWRWCRHA